MSFPEDHGWWDELFDNEWSFASIVAANLFFTLFCIPIVSGLFVFHMMYSCLLLAYKEAFYIIINLFLNGQLNNLLLVLFVFTGCT